MPDAEPTSLEQLLLAHVEASLLDGRPELRGSSHFQMLLREVLYHPELSPEEREVLGARKVDGQGGFQAIEDLSAVRVQRALDLLVKECERLHGDPAAGRRLLVTPLQDSSGRIPQCAELKRFFLERLLDPQRTTTLSSQEDFTLGPLESADGQLRLGEILAGKYRIVRQIGKGGFGAVYEAHDEDLDRSVAIKHLNASPAGTAQGPLGLRSEARRIARLSHPAIVDWKFFGEREDGSCYFVMEHLDGEDLESILAREGRLQPGRVARILLQVLDALRSAHELREGGSILHLDLKPKNVVLLPERWEGEGERVKVIDFGIGQYVGGAEQGITTALFQAAAGGESPTANIPSWRGTSPIPRCLACTPEYASPEQCRHVFTGEEVVPLDGRSDLYSLGVMAFQMLSGSFPFEEPLERGEYLRLHCEVAPRTLASLGIHIPSSLSRFVERCLQKRREARWPGAETAYQEMKRIVESLPAGAQAAEAPPEVRLTSSPESPRAGEPLLLRVEARGIPEGMPLRIEIGWEPREALIALGSGNIWSGPAPARTPLFFPIECLHATRVRLLTEARFQDERVGAVLETTVEPAAAPSFVGRVQEAKSFGRFMEERGSGLFILKGGPGAGKSRLARQLGLSAAAQGGMVAFGRARRSFRSPLQPFREALLELLHASESEVNHPGFSNFVRRRLEERFPREPSLADYFSAFLAREAISSDERNMISYYWLQLFQDLAGERPLLLILDDLQWTEEESIQLLSGLLVLSHERGVCLKLVVTVQPFGLGPEESHTLDLLEEAVRRLVADRVGVVGLDLGPLANADLAAFIDGFFPRNTFPRDLPWLCETLYWKTGGNPLFAEWVLKRLRAELESRNAAGDPALEPEVVLTPQWFDGFVPQEIESALDARLASLPPRAQEAAGVAAAIGDPFDLRLVERLLGGTEALDEALPLLETEELVTPTEDAHLWRFAHSLIPQRLLASAGARSRWRTARLHGRIAEAMAAVYRPEDLERHALAYAHHLIIGERRELGIEFLLRGAARLLDGQLYASAAGHLERARSLVDRGAALGERDRALLHLRLGKAYHVLGRTAEALRELEAATILERSLDDATRAAIKLASGSVLVQRGELSGAEGVFRSVLAADSPDRRLEVASALSGLGAIQRLRGRLQEALAEHGRALRLREEAGAETEAANSCVNLGNLHYDLGELVHAEAAYRRALPIYEKRGLKIYQVYALSGLANVLFRRGDPQASEFYQTAIRLCQETGNRLQLSVLHFNLGEIAMSRQRYSEALRGFTRSLAIMEAMGRRAGEAAARCRKAEVHRLLGDPEAASRETERALEAARATGSPQDLIPARIAAAQSANAGGDPGRAREEAEEALRLLGENGDVALRLVAALVLADLGALERTRRVLGEVPEENAGRLEPPARCLLEHLRGLCAPEAGAALACLERALELAPAEYPELPRLLADLAARATPERARTVLLQAAEVLRRRAEGIEDGEAKRRFLRENALHRRILERAAEAGSLPSS